MLLAMLIALAQANTTCTSIDGERTVVYASSAKYGGAMPGPSTVMFRATWTVDGTQIFEHVRPYEAPQTRTPDIDWAWDTDKTTGARVLRDDNTHYEVHYETEVRLFRPSGKPLVAGLTEWSGKVRCERVELRNRP